MLVSTAEHVKVHVLQARSLRLNLGSDKKGKAALLEDFGGLKWALTDDFISL